MDLTFYLASLQFIIIHILEYCQTYNHLCNLVYKYLNTVDTILFSFYTLIYTGLHASQISAVCFLVLYSLRNQNHCISNVNDLELPSIVLLDSQVALIYPLLLLKSVSI